MWSLNFLVKKRMELKPQSLAIFRRGIVFEQLAQIVGVHMHQFCQLIQGELSHCDAQEMATGISTYEGYAFIANRQG